jgi:hypothetical protein
MKKIKIEVVAIATGYYGNRIIREGQKFVYEGNLNNGKLPLWVQPADGSKFKAEKEEKVEAEVKAPAKKKVVKKNVAEEIV